MAGALCLGDDQIQALPALVGQPPTEDLSRGFYVQSDTRTPVTLA